MTELIKSLLMPSHVVMILLFVGMVLVILRRLRRLAIASFFAGSVLYILFSSGLVATFLISPLEYRHPYITSTLEYEDIETIVVLGGYAAEDPLMPLSSQANSASVYRILETFRLFSEVRWPVS